MNTSQQSTNFDSFQASENSSLRSSTQKPQAKKREVRSESPPPLRRLPKTPWKTVFLSLFLTFAGFLLVTTGFHNLNLEDYWNSFLYFLLAAMLLIPGLYHLHIIVRVVMGSPDYSYDMLTQIDD
ncbi:hypothetical protein ABPG74_009635 [Tetrahymena malaccensis]